MAAESEKVHNMIYESGEDYLETILLLQKEKGYVRSIDIAAKLSYSKPSVSRAMGILRENGYIVMDKSGLITLTAEGADRAQAVYQRHTTLTRYLHEQLGVDLAIAEHDACRMEHILSPETFEKIREKMEER